MATLKSVGFVGALLGLALLGTACANRNARTEVPADPPRTVVAQPTDAQGVYVDDSYVYQQVPSDAPPGAVGYEALSSGDQVVVVQYVHTYPEPIETYPRVYWSGRWYYNIEGDFVFWAPEYGAWVYYWGPPAPLIAYWNGYYPWAPYYWGVGYYGPGWYWGGVGYYGYHAYGLAVVHDHHHHHHYYETYGGGRAPNAGGSTGVPNTGGSNRDPARRNPPDKVASDAARRTPPDRSNADAARRTPPDRSNADAARRTPPGGTSTARVPTGDGVAVRAPSQSPQRTATDPAAKRGLPTQGAPGIAQRVPSPNAGRSSYTTASGTKVTVIDPSAARRTPMRQPTTVGSVDAATAPRRPTTGPRQDFPAWGGTRASAPTAPTFRPIHAPAPERSSSPVRSPSPNAAPSRSFEAPTRSAPDRSYSPSSAPSRSYTHPSQSAPSRSSSPPSRSTPSRSYSPSRSAPSPSRSAPSRSYSSPSPSRSAPMRSPSPSPSRSFSPSRSAPTRRPR